MKSLLCSLFLALVLQTATCIAEDEYRTENYLQIAPLTERRRDQDGWVYERANTVYCPPGTFITAYKLSYTSRNHYLENIHASCSALHTYNYNSHNRNNKTGFGRPDLKIIKVGVGAHPRGQLQSVDLQKGEQVMKEFVTSSRHKVEPATTTTTTATASYGDGFVSLSSYVQKAEDNFTTGAVETRFAISFYQQSARESIQNIKCQAGEPEASRNWRSQKVVISRCTEGFALCGIGAGIASPISTQTTAPSGGEAHIHLLHFECCYACRATEVWQPVWSTVTNLSESVQVHHHDIPVKVGVEFVPQAEHHVSEGTKGVSGEFSWNGHSANTDDDERAEYVVQEPFSVHFSYSLFGAKLVLPRLVNKEGEWSNNGADGAAGAEEYAQIKHLPGGNNDALVEKLYCYEIPDLRMNKDKYNDKFTPRIKWSKQYWSTIWQGGRELLGKFYEENQFSGAHNWGSEHEMFEDIRLGMGKFACSAAGTKCSAFQLVGQCGVMRVHIPKFCVQVDRAKSYRI